MYTIESTNDGVSATGENDSANVTVETYDGLEYEKTEPEGYVNDVRVVDNDGVTEVTTESVEHEHCYVWSDSVDPTCTEDGYDVWSCFCGDSYTEEVPAEGHDYYRNWCLVCGQRDPDAKSKLTFVDVDFEDEASHPFEVQWMADMGISTGWLEADGTRTFRGLQSVARCDLAVFLYRMVQEDGLVDDDWEPSAEIKALFKDVNKATPHANEIWWMAEGGIATGWDVGGGKKKFRPLATVARQDMAAFLHRFATYCYGYEEPGDEELSFVDVTSGDTANHADDVEWLASWGITKGWGPDAAGPYEFRGLNPVARQDLAAFLYRMSENTLNQNT